MPSHFFIGFCPIPWIQGSLPCPAYSCSVSPELSCQPACPTISRTLETLLPGSGNPALVLTLALDAHWEMRMFPAPLWLALFFKGKLGEMRIGDKRFHQVASFPSPLSQAPAHTTIIISSDFCSFLGSDYNFYRPARGLY